MSFSRSHYATSSQRIQFLDGGIIVWSPIQIDAANGWAPKLVIETSEGVMAEIPLDNLPNYSTSITYTDAYAQAFDDTVYISFRDPDFPGDETYYIYWTNNNGATWNKIFQQPHQDGTYTWAPTKFEFNSIDDGVVVVRRILNSDTTNIRHYYYRLSSNGYTLATTFNTSDYGNTAHAKNLSYSQSVTLTGYYGQAQNIQANNFVDPILAVDVANESYYQNPTLFSNMYLTRRVMLFNRPGNRMCLSIDSGSTWTSKLNPVSGLSFNTSASNYENVVLLSSNICYLLLNAGVRPMLYLWNQDLNIKATEVNVDIYDYDQDGLMINHVWRDINNGYILCTNSILKTTNASASWSRIYTQTRLGNTGASTGIGNNFKS